MLGGIVLCCPEEHQPSSLDSVAMEAELPSLSLLALNVALVMLRLPSNRETGAIQFRIPVYMHVYMYNYNDLASYSSYSHDVGTKRLPSDKANHTCENML